MEMLAIPAMYLRCVIAKNNFNINMIYNYNFILINLLPAKIKWYEPQWCHPMPSPTK